MQITPHIHVLQTPLGPEQGQFVNVYLLSSDHLTVIDTGLSTSSKLIINYIYEIGRNPSEIDMIVLTHRHPDHIGAAKAIHDQTDCEIAAHILERPAIETVDPSFLKSLGPGIPPRVGGSVPITYPLNDGDNLRVDTGVNLEVIHTPGHTPGSIALLNKEEKALFSGDAVVVPGRMPIYSDPVVSIRSIQRLKGIIGIKHFLPCHDVPVVNEASYERLDAAIEYIRHIDELVHQVSAKTEGRLDPEVLTREVLVELGIAQTHLAQLAVQTFIGHLNTQGLNEVLNVKG